MQFRSLKSVQTAFKVVRVFAVIALVIEILGAVLCFIVGMMTMSDGMYASIVGMAFAENFGVSLDTSTALAGWALFLLIIPMAASIVVTIFTWRYLTNELNRDCTPFSRRGVDELRRVAFVSIVLPIAAAIVLKIIYALVDIRGVSFFGEVFGSAIARGVALYILAYIFEHGAELAEKVNELSERDQLPPQQ